MELCCGDAAVFLPTLTQKVDAVIADPPFGIGFKYNEHDDAIEGYGPWLWSIVEQCEALCNPGSPVFIWQAMRNVRSFAEWFPRDWRIFAAAKNFVQMRPTAMQYSFDPVVVWWTEGKPWSEGTANRDFHIANTAPIGNQKGTIYDGECHPCPRPLDQMLHVVKQWVPPGGVVLDPFMGSGTTGVACALSGRDFIGIEKDQSYFAIAERRINRGLDGGPLFMPSQLELAV